MCVIQSDGLRAVILPKSRSPSWEMSLSPFVLCQCASRRLSRHQWRGACAGTQVEVGAAVIEHRGLLVEKVVIPRPRPEIVCEFIERTASSTPLPSRSRVHGRICQD